MNLRDVPVTHQLEPGDLLSKDLLRELDVIRYTSHVLRRLLWCHDVGSRWQRRVRGLNHHEKHCIHYGLLRECDYKNGLEQTNYMNDCCSMRSSCATTRARCTSGCCSMTMSSYCVMKNQNRTILHVIHSNRMSLHVKMSRC